jgi:thymidylate synthase (FAD)
MKLIKPSVEYIPQEKEKIPLKHIELCARTCYKSENKITVDSAHKFVEGLIIAGHWAMLEHGTLYLYLEVNPDNAFKKFKYVSAKFTAPYNWNDVVGTVAAKYRTNPYSRVNTIYSGNGRKVYITTNYRVILDNDWVEDFQFTCESPTEYHKKRYTLKFITDIGVCRELLRHRKFSFANESTRYCNYSKSKFGGELTFITPTWYTGGNGINDKECSMDSEFELSCEEAEKSYLRMISWGATPQEARQVLPLATKTELVMTGFADDWRHFFGLRLRGTTGKPHPDMHHLAQLAWNEFKDKLNLEL